MMSLCLKGLAFAALGASAAGTPEGCTAGTSAPSLVQKRAVVSQSVQQEESVWKGSSCSQRFPSSSSHPTACIVMRGDKTMLVKVPYGNSPGWDFPGGLHDRGEAPCETAEREVCEETGYSVTAYAKLTENVYLCRITGSNVCTKPKDEGFLDTRFFNRGEIEGLQMRGGTWGDKRQLLVQEFDKARSAPSGEVDACGCRPGENGWSTTRGRCSSSSDTDPKEAIGCQSRSNSADFDVCGCRRGVEGWSTTTQSCSTTSETSPEEVGQCRGMA